MAFTYGIVAPFPMPVDFELVTMGDRGTLTSSDFGNDTVTYEWSYGSQALKIASATAPGYTANIEHQLFEGTNSGDFSVFTVTFNRIENLYGYTTTDAESSMPENFYTTSTELTTNMPLYDNTGALTEYKLDTVLTAKNFRASKKVSVVKFKSSGTNTWYLDSEGNLYGCGDNTYGQMGIGSAPTTFTLVAQNVIDFDCSARTTWYINSANTLYGCGDNSAGQQGAGTGSGTYTSFTQRATNVRSIVATDLCTWYISTGDVLYGCGYNNTGCQGSGNTTNVTSFTQRGTNVKTVKAISGSVTWYLTNDNKLYGCGNNVHGNQGDGTGGTTDNYVKSFTQRASNVFDFDCTGQETWYVTTDYALYGCGRNNAGQQGISTSTARVLTFTERVPASGLVKKVRCDTASTWYIGWDSKLYGCGVNNAGQQGSGDTTNVTAFTQRAENVKDVYVGSRNTWYITNYGNLYGCGSNESGNQGIADTSVNVTTFTKRAENVKSIGNGDYNPTLLTYAHVSGYLTWNNNIYMCGDNTYGQQSSGDTTTVTAFTQRADVY